MMKLIEILDLKPQQQNLKRIKDNAKKQIDHAGIALERLRMLRAQRKLEKAKQQASTTP